MQYIKSVIKRNVRKGVSFCCKFKIIAYNKKKAERDNNVVVYIISILFDILFLILFFIIFIYYKIYCVYILTDNSHLTSERKRSRQIRILSVMLFYWYGINILLMYIGRNSCSCAEKFVNYAQDLMYCARNLMYCAEKYANYALKFNLEK